MSLVGGHEGQLVERQRPGAALGDDECDAVGTFVLEVGEQFVARQEVGAERDGVIERRPGRCPDCDDQRVVALVGSGGAGQGAPLGVDAEHRGAAEAPTVLGHEALEVEVLGLARREGAVRCPALVA